MRDNVMYVSWPAPPPDAATTTSSATSCYFLYVLIIFHANVTVKGTGSQLQLKYNNLKYNSKKTAKLYGILFQHSIHFTFASIQLLFSKDESPSHFDVFTFLVYSLLILYFAMSRIYYICSCTISFISIVLTVTRLRSRY